MFAVPDQKGITKEVHELSVRESKAMSAMLHRRQPELCEIIDWVGIDLRCTQAHWFCTMFCTLAFRKAEKATGYKLPRYAGYAIHEAAGFIVRGEEIRVGRKACGYPKRILRHVLINSGFDFDAEDSEWLCTTISAFLYIMERSLGRKIVR